MSTIMCVTLLNTNTTTNPSATLPYSWNRLRTMARRSSTCRSLTKCFARTSCEQKNETTDGVEPLMRMDRRNILLGLGGLYGFAGNAYKARGDPVQSVDLTQCQDAHADAYPDEDLKCCPPYSCVNDSNQCTIKDFTFPSQSLPLRVRKPAHKFSGTDLENYKTAITKMKALPDDDPWSFNNQAKIHCAYCDGAYDQVGFEGVKVDVHGSWLFAPWHRFYIYFYERILGKLIDDDSFALPYWNWDASLGMPIPEIFTDSSSSLYDENRNPDHLAYPALLDLNYSRGPPQTAVPATEDERNTVIANNLSKIHNAYNENICLPESFMGAKVSAGDTASSTGAGQLEQLHNSGHSWTGLPDTPYNDMGDFSTSGYDPLFYCHHSNVDRLWSIYSKFRGNQGEFSDTDWLDANFIFYDENRELVRVKVSDGIDPLKLRYTYEEVPLEWCNTTIRTSSRSQNKQAAEIAVTGTRKLVGEFGAEPQALGKTIQATIPRPEKSGEGDQLEVLVIDGIDEPNTKHVVFDIYIAVPADDGIGSELGALTGTFNKLPHGRHQGTQRRKSIFKTGITQLLEDIEAGDADTLVVSLVPRDGGDVSVGSIKIELVEKPGDCPPQPCV